MTATTPERPAIDTPQEISMNADQIKHMVDRFLAWRLPENFNPDAGISFKPTFNEHTAHPMRHEPVGTNLFDATQAEAMVRHMIEALPCSEPERASPGMEKVRGALGRAKYVLQLEDTFPDFRRIALEGIDALLASLPASPEEGVEPDCCPCAYCVERRAAPPPPVAEAGDADGEGVALLHRVMEQAENDLASAHVEICKLQGLDPATHSWPEWSSPANTLRWFKEIRQSLATPSPSPSQPEGGAETFEEIRERCAQWHDDQADDLEALPVTRGQVQRRAFHRQSAKAIRALSPSAPKPGLDAATVDRLDWLARNPQMELSHYGYDDDPRWQVHAVHGGRSDREWTLIGEGNTPGEALDVAIGASIPSAAPKGTDLTGREGE